MQNSAKTASSHKFYGEEEVAALVRRLDRAEDHHIFAEDVLTTYPHLFKSYTKVCPRRCDLATAAQKALDGAYSFNEKLTELREDVALMVSNCVAYNGPTSEYAETAAAFEKFALSRIDEFITEHNGGRRLSRLRLPNATPAASPAASGHITPSATEDIAKKAQAAELAEAKPSTSSSAPSPSTASIPSTREVVQLVDGLNRREDGGAFSVDVAEAYPDLRESYQKVCPHPMNLVKMHQRAKEGYYTSASREGEAAASSSSPSPSLSVYGVSVAASFGRLRADVELLVRNCITFNAKVDSWVTLARSFQAFAHRRIDDFVLRHEPALRGTLTGAQAYAETGTAKPTASASPVAEKVKDGRAGASITAAGGMHNDSSSSGAVHSAGAGESGRKRPRTTEERTSGPSAIAVPAPVEVVGETTPQICPTPLQPAFTVPPSLRRRLTREHLQHAQLPLRRVGISLRRGDLYPPAPSASSAPTELSNDAKTATPCDVEIDSNVSAGHVLRLLRTSIEDFFAHQRRRKDFVDAFAFSQREEQLYLSVWRVIAEQFERTVAHLLLYEREAAEFEEWAALRILAAGDGDTTCKADPTCRTHVADSLHYLYLVRFLVQFPQLACLCCCSASGAARDGLNGERRRGGGVAGGGGGSGTEGSLRISRDQLKVTAQVTLITQEFLNYVGRLDEKRGDASVLSASLPPAVQTEEESAQPEAST